MPVQAFVSSGNVFIAGDQTATALNPAPERVKQGLKLLIRDIL